MTPALAALTRMLAAPTRPKLGLERMAALLRSLGDPQQRVRVLHIAGTKGKGSTAAFAAAIARAAGLRVGLTTSPHLCTVRERIVIDGAMLDEAAFVDLEARVHDAAHALEASFFEQMIAMAFLAFSDARVDVAVVEVGLGGRLDATNVCAPSACAITRLALDHTEWLGPTIEHIAAEKAGILKAGVPAVSAQQSPAAAAVLARVAADVGAPLRFVESDSGLRPAMRGDHQHENASLAAALVAAAGISVSRSALERAVAQTVVAGRYETLTMDPMLVVDGAHNAAAAEVLAATISADERVHGRPLVLVVGMTAGHAPADFARALLGGLDAAGTARPHSVLAVPFGSQRAQPCADVARAWARETGVAHEVATLRGGLDLARTIARRRGGAVMVTGSLYLVGDARHVLLGVPRDPVFPLF